MERWQKTMERSGNAPPYEVPVALAREGHHGPVIYASNRTAQMAGIKLGARVTDMRALCPELNVEYADIGGDKLALERLVLWARRWCPWTVSDGEDGIILDTTGADHLLGGEASMLVEMEERLSLLGLTSQLAIAPSWGAAWALARFGTVRTICAEDQVIEKLSPLPVQALRLDSKTVLLLQRLGLKTIGSLIEIPRLSLTRRFVKAELHANPLLRLDQATGRLAEPVSSLDAPPVFRVQNRLPEPIQDPTAYLPALCQDLCAALTAKGVGSRKLHLTVFRTDGEVSAVEIATSSPSRNAEHFVRLFDGKLERINPGFGFDLITLEASAVEPIEVTQTRLDDESEEYLHISRLIDRLAARFGHNAVSQVSLSESHVPERAEAWVSALGIVEATTALTPRLRPLRLLEPPEEVRVLYTVPEGPPAQLVWRAKTYRVTRYAGPERIAPEWWHDRPDTRLRDYFRIEDHEGRRFWLYREGLHEDGRGGDPRWFMHGMFA